METSLESLVRTLECPITKVRMRDPVMLLADGHTYDRSSIELWLKDHMISPMTNLPIDNPALCTNWIARTIIDITAKTENDKCPPLPRRARKLDETLNNVEPIDNETFINAARSPALLAFSCYAMCPRRQVFHCELIEQAKAMPSHVQLAAQGVTQKPADTVRSVRRNIGAKEFYSLAQIFSLVQILRTIGYTAHKEIRNKRLDRGFYVACTVVHGVQVQDCVFINCVVSCKEKTGCLMINSLVTYPDQGRDCMFIEPPQDP